MAKTSKNQNAAVLEKRPLKLAAPRVRIAFPGDGETISHPSYSFRIETSAKAAGVDICIDQGDWEPCRESLGLWWYDWNGYDSGEHEAVARLRGPEGRLEISDVRVFMVELDA